MRFTLEASKPLQIAGQRLRQDLQRDIAPELGVTRAIDLPHAAGAKEREDFVGAKAGPGEMDMDLWGL